MPSSIVRLFHIKAKIRPLFQFLCIFLYSLIFSNQAFSQKISLSIFPLSFFSRTCENPYYCYLKAEFSSSLKEKEKWLKNTLKVAPQSKFLQIELLKVYLDEKKLEKALSIALKLYNSSIGEEKEKFAGLIAKIYMEKGDFPMAITFLEKYIKNYGKNKKILGILIGLYFNQKEWQKALLTIEKFLNLEEKNFSLWYFKARALEKLGKIEEAKRAYLKALKLSNYNKFILLNAVSFFEKNGFVSEEKKVLQKYLSLHPDDALVQKLLISFYIEQGEWKRAEKIVNSYLKKHPNSPWFLYFLGIILEKKENFQKALSLYKKIFLEKEISSYVLFRIYSILKRLPPEKRQKFLLGLYERYKKNKKAIKTILDLTEILDMCELGITIGQKAFKNFPNSFEIALSLASNYACLDNYNASLKVVLPLLSKYPDNPVVLNFVGYSYVELGTHLDLAEKLLKKAIKKTPEDPYILDSLAWLYYKKKNLEKALFYIKKCLKNLKEPEATIYEHAGFIYYQLGQTKKACKLFKKALKAALHKKEIQKIQRILNRLCKGKGS